jgi:hypothetical protein
VQRRVLQTRISARVVHRHESLRASSFGNDSTCVFIWDSILKFLEIFFFFLDNLKFLDFRIGRLWEIYVPTNTIYSKMNDR